MLVFKKGKLVECTGEDFERIEGIYQSSSCLQAAVERLYTEFVYYRIPYKAESKRLSTTVVRDMAYNAVSAVV